NPLKTSLTYIFATRRGVPLRLSSVRSSPRMCMISLKCLAIFSIFSSSSRSKASGLSGVSVEEDTWSSSSSSWGLRGRIFNEISFCLIQCDFQFEFGVNLLPQYPPDDHCDVLSRRIEIFKIFGIEVQILVVESGQNVFLDDVAQRLQVIDKPGIGLW